MFKVTPKGVLFLLSYFPGYRIHLYIPATHFFYGVYQQLHFVPKSGVGRGTGAFIYALSADETSPAVAAPRHAITAPFSCRFKCPCPPRRQWHFYGNADRAYNTLHFASKVVCQRVPLWKPRTTKQAEYLALSRCLILNLYLLSAAPVSWSACSSL